MHYFEKLPILTALSTLIAASVASPAPAPASAEGQPAITKMIVTMSTVNKWRTTIGETPEIGAPVDSAESGLVGNLYEYTKGCNGNSPPTGASVLDIVILGAPGSYACIPVPAGWTMKALEFEEYVNHNPYPSHQVYSFYPFFPFPTASYHSRRWAD